MKLENEPTLHEIDDYDNNESPEKRKTIYWIIGIMVVIGIGSYIYLGNSASLGEDYVGTAEQPGIISTKPF
ncbi:MAG TPA: hypothetical protein ENK94_00630 [Campylobacterales bacterium]|nr:hypothetical protein [Campylobacterales bacterium]